MSKKLVFYVIVVLFSMVSFLQTQPPGGPAHEMNAPANNAARTIRFINQTDAKVHVWIPTARDCWNRIRLEDDSGIITIPYPEGRIYIYTSAGIFFLEREYTGSYYNLRLYEDKSMRTTQNFYPRMGRRWDAANNIVVTIHAVNTTGMVTFE